MIVMWNRKIIKVVWSSSQWSTTSQKETGLSMITFSRYFLAISSSINTIKWTLHQVWLQALIYASQSTRISQLWYQNWVPRTPHYYSFYVMIVTQNWKIIKLFWPPTQCSTNHQIEIGLSMITSYRCFLDINTAINAGKWFLLQVLG